MAKKIVRGITDVKTINNQDFDTNNVNDLLSDGQYNYIHRKKGKAEEYHNLTDNIKTLSSDNTDLLTVTNNNKTTNTATLHPKHDAQKEQLLESTRDTITINHATNGTAEKTTVDVNFDKVQAKLTAGEGITIRGNTISATGGTTHTIQFFSDTNFKAYKHRVRTSQGALSTLSFKCYNAAECVITGKLKQYLESNIKPNKSISNGAISITNDGTTMKLINSAPSENVHQQGTFTFYDENGGGGDITPSE